jgi:hypothetical protein
MRSIPALWSLLGAAWILALTCGTGLVHAVHANGAGHEHTVYSEPSCRKCPARRSRLLCRVLTPRQLTSAPSSGQRLHLRSFRTVPLTRCDIGWSAQNSLEARGYGAHLDKLEGIG